MTFDPEKADDYYDNAKFDELEKYLDSYYEKEKDNVEVVWRLARAYHAKTEASKSLSKKEKEKLIRNALKLADDGMELDDKNSNPYKWKAILLGELGNYIPVKEKIHNSFTIKELFLKSLEYNATDAAVMFGLGEWCYRVANTGWATRKIAATLFDTPPESTFDEACDWYRKALKENPEFKRCYYSLGEALWAKGEKKAAYEQYKKCTEIEATREIERTVDQKARARLKGR